MSDSAPFRLLFVCMGNICRSPAAQGVMEKCLRDAGLDKHVEVDSAGTINLHTGNLPDPRMRQAARRRGYTLTGNREPFPFDEAPGALRRDFDLVELKKPL